MLIAIVDDMEEDRRKIRSLLECYFKGKYMDIHCHEFDCGEALLAVTPQVGFDLIFLDVYMEGISGMDTARQLTQQRDDWRIVFLTTSRDHAIESYEVRASYYLTKPLSSQQLETALDNILRGVLAQKAALRVRINQVETPLRLQNLLYVACIQRCARIHIKNRVIAMDNSIKEILDRLSTDPRFIVCNRDMAVNMEWVEDIVDNNFILKNGE